MTEYFSNIKDVLGGVEFRSVRPAFAKIVEDWDNIVGKKFSGRCVLSEIIQKSNRQILLVNVKSSPLVQELGFFKANLIKKINEKYLVDIADIIIKVSNDSIIKDTPFRETEVLEVYSERPTDDDLRKIVLDDVVIERLKASVEKQPALSQKQKERMFNVIVNDLKTQEWMKEKGFPVCKKCGRVMTKKTFGEENICDICKNADI